MASRYQPCNPRRHRCVQHRQPRFLWQSPVKHPRKGRPRIVCTQPPLSTYTPACYVFNASILYSETSITDPWARAIAYHFLNGTTNSNFYTNDTAHGAGQLWSNVPRQPSFQQFISPFPIIAATSLPIGSNLSTPPLSQTVYEVRAIPHTSHIM